MGFEPTVCGDFMAINRNKQRFSTESAQIAQPAPEGVAEGSTPLCVMETSDVRPKKVSKAKQLIARPTYPPVKVVRSLAKQIARFF